MEEDAEKASTDGKLSKNIQGFIEQRLLLRMAENTTLRRWFGPRSPQTFAHAIVTAIYGGPRSGPEQVNDMPAFLASGRYASMGSGFLISSDGWMLTNYHVVGTAKAVDVRLADGTMGHATIQKTDPSADIALLKCDVPVKTWIPLSKGETPMGASVFTIGFPLPTLQGVEPKFTDGRISSLSGIRDDRRVYQVTVPIQSGNSGGPLVHLQSGWVVGMMRAKLSAEAAGEATRSRITRSRAASSGHSWSLCPTSKMPWRKRR